MVDDDIGVKLFARVHVQIDERLLDLVALVPSVETDVAGGEADDAGEPLVVGVVAILADWFHEHFHVDQSDKLFQPLAAECFILRRVLDISRGEEMAVDFGQLIPRPRPSGYR